jgi:hypothetical protein
MHPLPEEEEAMLGGGADGVGGAPTVSPPALPSPPLLMSPEQTKRRYIVSSLVQSENNYLGRRQCAHTQQVVSVTSILLVRIPSS